MASHASRARAGRSRQRQSKWADSTRRCTRTALVTAPFHIGHDPAAARAPMWLFPLEPSIINEKTIADFTPWLSRREF